MRSRFHCYAEQVFSMVQVHGKARSAPVRRAVRNLERAGYAPRWKRDDELGYHRWLSGARQHVAELRFLRTLDRSGVPDDVPQRAVTSKPVRPRRRSERDWLLSIEAARNAGLAWTYCATDFLRRETLAPL